MYDTHFFFIINLFIRNLQLESSKIKKSLELQFMSKFKLEKLFSYNFETEWHTGTVT